MQIANILPLFFIVFLSLFNCAGPVYDTGNSPGFVNGDGNGLNTTTNPTNNTCANGGLWGGVSCSSGSDSDPSYRQFISSGSDISPSTTRVGAISCNPGDRRGILIRLAVKFNGVFDPNGSNNRLIMQPGSSEMDVVVHYADASSGAQQTIKFELQGQSGEVNGNRASLIFADSKGTVTVSGSFTAQSFSGDISFANEQDWNGKRPGAKGTLGRFQIDTCSAFSTSNI